MARTFRNFPTSPTCRHGRPSSLSGTAAPSGGRGRSTSRCESSACADPGLRAFEVLLRATTADTHRAQHLAITLDQHGTKAGDDRHSDETVGDAEEAGSVFGQIAERRPVAVEHRSSNSLRLRDLRCQRGGAVHAGERDEKAAFIHDGDGDPNTKLRRLRMRAADQLLCLTKAKWHAASFAACRASGVEDGTN